MRKDLACHFSIQDNGRQLIRHLECCVFRPLPTGVFNVPHVLPGGVSFLLFGVFSFTWAVWWSPLSIHAILCCLPSPHNTHTQSLLVYLPAIRLACSALQPMITLRMIDLASLLVFPLYFSEKNRAPAWCDRVLWYGDTMSLIDYRSHPVLKASDHKPVSALFIMTVRICYSCCTK